MLCSNTRKSTEHPALSFATPTDPFRALPTFPFMHDSWKCIVQGYRNLRWEQNMDFSIPSARSVRNMDKVYNRGVVFPPGFHTSRCTSFSRWYPFASSTPKLLA